MSIKRLAASLPLLVLVACSDDAPECVGHLCSNADVKYTDPEGGNILFEYIYFDTELQAAFRLPAGVTTLNRVMAYFLNSQTPEANPLPEPGKCNNLVATKGWPMFTGTPHEDLDVGKLTMTGKNKAGSDVTFEIPKMPKGIDSIGRPHDQFYQLLHPNADDNLQFNSSYTVNIEGNGTTIAPATLKDALFLSADFTVTMPNIEGNGPMKANADFTVKWNPVESSNLPQGSEILGVTWLVDSNGSPTHMCPVAHSAGTFTIPAASIAEYRDIATARGANPNKIILLRNAIVHRLSPLPTIDGKNQRRIDMVTVNCWAQLMDCAAQ
jgi:hypothetical protein